jgi:hypothetical protein
METCYKEGCGEPVWCGACEKHTEEGWKSIEKRAYERIFRGMRTYAAKDNLEERKVRVMYIIHQYEEKIRKELSKVKA